MSAANLHDLADELGGHIVHADNGGVIVLPGGGVVYAAFTGAVKLQRYGRVVETLGTLSDGTEAIAARYRELTVDAAVAS